MPEPAPGVLSASFARVLVWDAPTRVCHWLLVVCFAGAYGTANRGGWEWVHATLGYTASGLVLFRILWGLCGTRYVRFSHSIQRPAAVITYLAQLPYGWSKRYLGHSPASALLVIFFLALALVVCASGWAQRSSTPSMDFGGRLHAAAAGTMLATIGLHMTFILFSSWRSGENLLLSLITGTKWGTPSEAIPSARPRVALLLLAAVLGFWLYQWVSFSGGGRAPEKPIPVVQMTLHFEDVAHLPHHRHAHPAC